MESLLLGASAVAILVGLGGLVCNHRRWPRAPARKPMKRSRVVTACLLSLLGLASATSFAQIGTSTPGCDANSLPDLEQAIIYRHSNYRGDCRILSVGNYANSTYFGLPNDSVSSLKVGENVQIDLFVDSGFRMYDPNRKFSLQGPNEGDSDYEPGAPVQWRELNLSQSQAGDWNDITSSIRVQRKDRLGQVPDPGQVVLFQQANFNNTAALWAPRDYIMKDASDRGQDGAGVFKNTAEVGLENDSISSIRVGFNTCVKVCSDANFQGDCDVFTGDQESMSGTSVGNDHATSVQVIFPLSMCMP